MLAWNARVGYSLERRRTQAAYDELVFNSIKLSMNASACQKYVCVITKKYTIDAPFVGIGTLQLNLTRSLSHDGIQNGTHQLTTKVANSREWQFISQCYNRPTSLEEKRRDPDKEHWGKVGRGLRKRRKSRIKTYRDAGRDQVTLVQNKDQVLVGGFLLQVLLDTQTPGAEGVSSIKHMDDDVRRVHDLVEFVPDSLALTLVKDGLDGHGEGLIVVIKIGVARSTTQQPGLLEAILVGVHALLSVIGQVGETADAKLNTLPLCLRAEDI